MKSVGYWLAVFGLAVCASACGSSDGGNDAAELTFADVSSADSSQDDEDAGGTDEDAGVTTEPTSVAPVYPEATFEVRVTDGVVYGQGLSHSDWGAGDGTPTDLLLDVYEPIRDDEALMPVVVVIHGGGFTGGTRKATALSEMAMEAASRGFVAFSIDYRLLKNHGSLPSDYPVPPAEVSDKAAEQFRALYPACRDAKAAIRWIRAHADEYSISKAHVAAIGGSAGSFLALSLGITDEADCVDEISTDEDSTLAGTHLDESSAVQAIVDHWGGTAIMDMLEMMGGESRFDESDAPVSIIHGTEDPTVLFSEAEALRDHYEATGVYYEYRPLVGAGHGAWNATYEGQNLTELALQFMVPRLGLSLVE